MFESRVTWAISVPIFSLPRPLCSRVTPNVRDRQTADRRQTKALLNASALCLISLAVMTKTTTSNQDQDIKLQEQQDLTQKLSDSKQWSGVSRELTSLSVLCLMAISGRNDSDMKIQKQYQTRYTHASYKRTSGGHWEMMWNCSYCDSWYPKQDNSYRRGEVVHERYICPSHVVIILWSSPRHVVRNVTLRVSNSRYEESTNPRKEHAHFLTAICTFGRNI